MQSKIACILRYKMKVTALEIEANWKILQLISYCKKPTFV